MWYTIGSIFYFFLAIILSQFIAEPNLKITYWLMLFLLHISLSNIYMSTYFYIKLRETPGIKGERGSPGVKGQKGSNGVCVVSPSCGIANCRGLIEKEMIKRIVEYKDIKNKISQSIMLNADDKRILNKLNGYIDVLLPICESGKMSKSEFINHIKNSL
jgi:hypothetical protein